MQLTRLSIARIMTITRFSKIKCKKTIIPIMTIVQLKIVTMTTATALSRCHAVTQSQLSHCHAFSDVTVSRLAKIDNFRAVFDNYVQKSKSLIASCTSGNLGLRLRLRLERS